MRGFGVAQGFEGGWLMEILSNPYRNPKGIYIGARSLKSALNQGSEGAGPRDG